jgi:IS30 family transposase
MADGSYESQPARAAHAARRRAARAPAKLATRGVLWGVVTTMLSWKWSPQQIAATLRRVDPDDPDFHVSHKTIYTAIYAHARGELRRELIACLRQGKGARMPCSRDADRRGQLPEIVSIHVRPPEVDDRVMPGHWEGDLIKGAGSKSSVGVLVERSSRLVLLARMESATAEAALAAFTVKLNSIAAPMRQTLTCDQGKEMARHADLARATGMRVYGCTSATLTAPGSAAPARTPTTCCGSTSPRARICLSTRRTNWMRLPTASTHGLVPRMTGTRRLRSSDSPWQTRTSL